MKQNWLPSDAGTTRVLGSLPLKPASSSAEDASNLTDHNQFRRSHLTRDDLSGLQLGAYALGNKLGEGGMGKLFHARHEQLGKACAIKFIHPAMASNGYAISRFLQETQAVGQLNHPHIVCALDAGCCDGVHFYITELLEGQDLQRHVQVAGPVQLEQTLPIMRQVLDALAHAHERGLVHRDIKPSNIFLTDSGYAKLLDFGLARNTQRPDQGLTSSEQLLGTLDYLAPEQAEDPTQATATSDIYSLGLTWIYLLSGKSPFPDSHYATTVSKLRGQLVDQPAWLTDNPQKLPAPVIALLTAMVAKDPSHRPKDCREVIARMDACSQQLHDQSHNKSETLSDLKSSVAQKKLWTIGVLAAFFCAGLVFLATFAWTRLDSTLDAEIATESPAILNQDSLPNNPEQARPASDSSLSTSSAAESVRTLPSNQATANAKAVRRSGVGTGNATPKQFSPFTNHKD